MESIKSSFFDFSEPEKKFESLEQVKERCFELIKNLKKLSGGELPNEVFDRTIRAELWLGCLPAVEKVIKDEGKRLKVIKEIIFCDKVSKDKN